MMPLDWVLSRSADQVFVHYLGLLLAVQVLLLVDKHSLSQDADLFLRMACIHTMSARAISSAH